MAVFITLIGKNTRWFYTSALSFSLPDYFQMLKVYDFYYNTIFRC
ncbi:hypothetical protein LTSEWAN_4767 [Salmonella enterica subsp. enterica serovar Wandsworth str. A4-580]|uniref:Uncharacterized protein n=1 Tax=Salmonella enterica subsp. enterica serovar Wandsworth str. A4-580 TaxID=913086 RepID=G5SGT6_SALET|nr:hypothetical protein LTSEWAN_4767 [Salmonella enterica subsp. enterica serovar Wandsworth str. A4-580]